VEKTLCTTEPVLPADMKEQVKNNSNLTFLAHVSTASPQPWLMELGNGQTNIGLV
jgi:hypothetical protein